MMPKRVMKFRLSFISSITAWCLLTCCFYHIRHAIPYINIEKYFPIIELILDIPITYFSWVIYKKLEENKPIFFLFLSFANLILTDAGFYFVYYIVNFRDSSNIWNSLYMLPFLVFLLGQLVFWASTIKQNIFLNANRSYIVSLFLILSLFAMAIFIMSTTWKVNIFSYVGFYDVLTAILEFIIFDLAILSLVCSNNLGINFISSGIIILIATNLWEKYIFSSGRWSEFNLSEIFWLLGQIILIFGLHYININKSHPISWMNSLKKIKSQISLWIFSLMNLSFLALFFAGYFSGLINKNSLMSLPFLMMIYALVIVLISNYIGSKFEKPFGELKNNIDILTTTSKIENISFAKNLLTDEFIFLQRFIINAFKTLHEQNKEKLVLSEIALRAAHDIRSPLASMEANLHILMRNVPKEKLKMMNIAIQSVRDISNNLLEHYRSKQVDIHHAKLNKKDDVNMVRFILLFSIVDQVVSQKRYEWLNKSCELTLEFSSESKSMWVKAAPAEIKRMISNLLNNAIEACDKAAKIRLSLFIVGNFIELRITDNGVGIPSDMIELYLNGMSSKHSGEGLGLSNAKNYLESIDGQLEIISSLNNGTTILLKFIYSNPAWYPDQILLTKDDNVLVLDDDIAMRSLWMHRLENYPVKTHFFYNYNDAESWITENLNQHDKMVLLVDYELSCGPKNGLMLLKQYGFESDSYLVTSHADEFYIQNEVDKLKINLIPKFLANEVPIKLL